MAIINPPSGYYDRQPDHLNWEMVLFKPGVPLQSAEVNEVQTIATYNFSQFAQALFPDGTYLSGGSIGINPNSDGTITISVTAGAMYAGGYVHSVPAGTATITGVGSETVSVVIADIIYTALSGVPGTIQDTSLLNPAEGAEGYGQAGADRLSFSYTFAANSNLGIVIANFVNGQLVTTNYNTLLNQILTILAQRTYEESGSFLAVQPTFKLSDITTSNPTPATILLEIDSGIGYIQGYRQQNTQTLLPVVRPMTTVNRVAEPFTFTTGTTVYTVDNPPYLNMTTVQAELQSPTINMTRGGVVNGQDAIPSQWQPVVGIVSVIAGDTTYINGTDYALSGNNVEWLPGGSQPEGGDSYDLVVNYEIDLTKAIRTLTTDSSDVQTVSSSTTTLSHTDISELTALVRNSDSYAYTEGVDYTLATNTGVITWLNYGTNPVDSDNVTAQYTYWAHTVEGDFVSRDSFVDSTGDNLYYSTPTTSPNGHDVDYTSQLAFETSSDNVPLNDSVVFLTYQYVIGRIDVLAWHFDGILSIIEGTPGLNPVPPSVDVSYCPIAQIILPPEAFAATTTLQLFNNLTMTVNNLRSLQNQVSIIQYNEAQFQLASSTANINTATDKIGIFADPLTNPGLADVTSDLFDGTFDFGSGQFLLPRTSVDYSDLVPASLTGCSEVGATVYLNNYAELTYIAEAYISSAFTINEFSAINGRATITANPNQDIDIVSQTLNTQYTLSGYAGAGSAYGGGTASGASNNLTANQVSNAPLLLAINQNVAIANQLGTPYTNQTNPLLQQVAPPTSWSTNELNSGYLNQYYPTTTASTPSTSAVQVVSDSWGSVLETIQVVLTGSGAVDAATVALTGSNFRAGDRAISLTFDGIPLPLTPTGSTVADTDPWSGCVIADSSGNWTATFVVPEGTTSGIHNLVCVAHDALNVNVVSSVSTLTYLIGIGTEQITQWVNITPPSNIPCSQLPAYEFCATLGIGVPNQSVLSVATGPMGYVLAYLFVQYSESGLELDYDLLTTAIGTYFSSAWIVHDGALNVTPTEISALVSALEPVLPSTDVTSLWNIIASIIPNVGLTNGSCVGDPLAQTFTVSQDVFVSSVELYFSIAPASGVPVRVTVAETSNGVPTSTYLGTAIVESTDIVVSQTQSTKFTFTTPIFLTSGITYCFIVATDDPDAAIYTAVLGQTDLNGLGLITSNPSAGAMLQSPNMQTWELVDGTSIASNINICNFTSTSGTVNFGNLTLGEASSILAFYHPYSLPDSTTSVVYQYSLDGTEWKNFVPMAEFDLTSSITSLYLQILLTGSQFVSPILQTSNILLGYSYQGSGCYIHREFDLPESAAAEYIDIWVDTYIPGGTTLAFQFSGDGGNTWNDMSIVSSDTTAISDTVNQQHYTYDAGSATITSVVTRCNMTSSVNYVSPFIANYRVIASA